MKNLILKSILSGVLIAMAGWIFLSCQKMDIGTWAKVIGAALFSIGLISVCELKAKLFTGVVGNIDSKKTFIEALIILAFNMISAALVGVVFRFVMGENQVFADIVDNQTWYRVFFESCICGSLIYLAVTIYKQHRNILVLIICVMAFILSGSLHSIACCFYIVLGKISGMSFLYLFIIILGNSVGALALRFLNMGLQKINVLPTNKDADEETAKDDINDK